MLQIREFADKIACARAQWEQTRIERIHAAADSHDQKDAWRANAWLLNNHPATRQRYHEHRTTSSEQTIQVHHAHTLVRELSDAELLALDSPDEAPGLDR